MVNTIMDRTGAPANYAHCLLSIFSMKLPLQMMHPLYQRVYYFNSQMKEDAGRFIEITERIGDILWQ